MANFGIVAGGIADSLNAGLSRNQQYDYQQKELAIQKQAQDMAQQRFQMGQYMDLYKQGIEHMSDYFEQWKIAHPGGDIKQAAAAMAPTKDNLKTLLKNMGQDPNAVEGLWASMLTKPVATDVLRGTTNTNPYPARPAVPGRQTFAPTETIQPGGSVEELPPGAPLPIGGAAATQPQGDDVDRLTQALGLTGNNVGLRTALAGRLQEALRLRGDNTEVKILKDENQNDHVVFIDKRNKTVTDSNGQPFVTPTGDSGSDAKAIVDAMKSGKQPPTFQGLYKNTKAIRAEAARQGFDVSQAQLEWEAARKQVASLNGPQMIRYAGLAKSVVNTIDEVNSLAKQMGNIGVPLLNKAAITAYIQTAGNSESGKLAASYLGAVNTLKEEFANLAQGGYAPTEPAWTLADQQINGNYGVDELGASLTEVQRLINYRISGIPNFNQLGPGAPNRYTPAGSGQTEQPGATATPTTVDPSKMSDDDIKKRLRIQ